MNISINSEGEGPSNLWCLCPSYPGNGCRAHKNRWGDELYFRVPTDPPGQVSQPLNTLHTLFVVLSAECLPKDQLRVLIMTACSTYAVSRNVLYINIHLAHGEERNQFLTLCVHVCLYIYSYRLKFILYSVMVYVLIKCIHFFCYSMCWVKGLCWGETAFFLPISQTTDRYVVPPSLWRLGISSMYMYMYHHYQISQMIHFTHGL